jgi:aminomethyltransferase
VTPGYQALREGAGWLDLSSRGRIVARGRDRARLLHAITSNEVKKMTPGSGCYAFLLSPQGRIQADLNLFCFEDHFLIDTEPELREKVHQHIKRYIIADQVELEDVTSQTGCIGVEGPVQIVPVPEADYSHAQWEGCTVARVTVTGQPGARIFCAADRAAEVVAKLEAAGARPATLEDARIVRIENGKPRYGEEITDTTLPQESQQMHAVSFTKGCYLGQEIVERIRARGHVNKKLTPFEGTAPEGAEVLSSVVSPSTGKTVGIALVRA